MNKIDPGPQAASAASIIDTGEQRLVVALFHRRADAVTAIASLKFQGFADANIDLFVADDLQQERLEAAAGRSNKVSIAHTLSTMGISQDVANDYETDVRLGMALVIVIAGERSIEALNILRNHSEEEEEEIEGVDNIDEEGKEAVKEDIKSDSLGGAPQLGEQLVEDDPELPQRSR
jgi:hypothetical protein